MPRIVNDSERLVLSGTLWQEDLERKYVRIPESVTDAAYTTIRALAIPPHMLERLQELPQQYSYVTPQDKCTIFNLIEEVIENTMKSNYINSDFFNEFVDIKEVP